jgi:hypothetical protein
MGPSRVAVDRGGGLLGGLGTVHLGPGGGVEHDVGGGHRVAHRDRFGDVQIGAGRGHHVGLPRHGQIPAEHPGRAGASHRIRRRRPP